MFSLTYQGAGRLTGERNSGVPARLLRPDAGMLDHDRPADGGQGWTGARSRARSMPAT
jgi:hypothetical protein